MSAHGRVRVVAAGLVAVLGATVPWVPSAPPRSATAAAEEAPHADAEDAAALVEGVAKIAKPGIPGPIACVSETAFAVVTGRIDGQEHAVVAAARHGKGRVVAFGHDGYFSEGGAAQGDTRRLVANACRWAARPGKRRVAGLVGHAGLAKTLEGAGFEVKVLDGRGWTKAADEIDLLIASEAALPDDAHEKALAEFVEGGGGFVTCGLAWGWMQIHDDLDICRDHALNRVLAPMGLAFVDGYIDTITSPAAGEASAARASAHALGALAVIEAPPDAKTKPDSPEAKRAAAARTQALAVVAAAYRWLPAGSAAFRERVRALVAKVEHPIVPTHDRPLRATDTPRRLALLVAHVDAERAAPEDTKAAGSASDFPGAPPKSAPRVKTDVEIEIDVSVPGWASTGLWAVAGEVVEVDLPSTASGEGFGLRIGCHTDTLWAKDAWSRHPEISRRFPAAKGVNRIASPHGGLLYVEVPKGKGGATGSHVRVKVSGGVVESPRFVLGRTSAEEWKKARTAPAPWAELECRRVTLTVRSEDIRDLADPQALMEHWDRVLGFYAELGERPLDARPQRFVPDRQISAGWLHSGYPIMAQLLHSPMLVDLRGMTKLPKDAEGAWGFWHELGHNHQRPEWTFDGTTEVTCNLFSLFVDEKLRGLAPEAHPWARNQLAAARRYLEKPDFGKWKSEPGIALWTYIELQTAFGWAPFREAFATYVKSPDAALPKTDDAKRDEWLVRMSKAVGRNLAPHFAKWGVPVSAGAVKQVASLPAWSAPPLPEPPKR